MSYENRIPKEVPEPGFYYHYKHDPAKGINDYAYYVYGVGHHTEDDCRPQDANMLVYRPIYKAFVYENGKLFDLRPLEMFYQQQEWQGKMVPRFTKIEDPIVIVQLQAIKKQMYPEG